MEVAVFVAPHAVPVVSIGRTANGPLTNETISDCSGFNPSEDALRTDQKLVIQARGA